jgi:hypothetical protein
MVRRAEALHTQVVVASFGVVLTYTLKLSRFGGRVTTRDSVE